MLNKIFSSQFNEEEQQQTASQRLYRKLYFKNTIILFLQEVVLEKYRESRKSLTCNYHT
jgi:hypothetical protein